MKKKNKQILDDVQKYLKDDSEQSKKKNKIQENKEDDSQNFEEKNFEYIVRSEVKSWIKENAMKLSSIAIEKAIKDINEKKKYEPNILIWLLQST